MHVAFPTTFTMLILLKSCTIRHQISRVLVWHIKAGWLFSVDLTPRQFVI